ncbi:Uncharacterised protein [Salmonella enterica subsp. enterica serovar Bovismorbificans]|nr:Uncharacterised protein [Salmonella enterica subsp. enterica serovar Bovismorbificans]CNT83255.1 Uncharacterised protein [Salmonella enterica subsp. enterica serovar Bovismorbificans]
MQLIGRFDKLLFSALGDGKILVRVLIDNVSVRLYIGFL